ncbi:MAG: hypothetical protein ACP5OA_02555 [Candidatus Woesearchaeota archaeon]
MVKTADDILDINPLERMERLEGISGELRKGIAQKKKELNELEKRKKLEIDELDVKKRKELEELENIKRRELDNLDIKRKELHELEAKKVKEIEETQELIERSFQELMRHKKIILEEDEEKNKKKMSGETNLEEVANANMPPKFLNQNVGMDYSKFFENLQAPQRLYDITNNSFYNGLTNLRDKAAKGEITAEEELFIERLRNQFEQFNNNQSYVERDQNQYIRRSMNVIDQIGKYQRLKID